MMMMMMLITTLARDCSCKGLLRLACIHVCVYVGCCVADVGPVAREGLRHSHGRLG